MHYRPNDLYQLNNNRNLINNLLDTVPVEQLLTVKRQLDLTEIRIGIKSAAGRDKNYWVMSYDDLADLAEYATKTECFTCDGAITVLQAEYDLCNGHELAKRLPTGFNYAGVISYAGAVSGVLPPHWEKMPCPIMLFHGDADKTVPFEQAAMENLGGLWGSSAVAKSLENLQASYYFYKVENAGHEISGLPMSRNQYDIMSFLSRQVLGDENLAITTDERVPGDTIVRKDFTVQDYILDNLR